LGYLDDLLLVPLGIILAIKMIPAEVLVDCRAKADEVMKAGKPINWVAAAFIIAIWIFALILSIQWIKRLFTK
jgi:hypothetical protein